MKEVEIDRVSSMHDKLGMSTKFYSQNPKGRDHFKDLGIDGRIISKQFLKKWDLRLWT
jgi:hypothetical protein